MPGMIGRYCSTIEMRLSWTQRLSWTLLSMLSILLLASGFLFSSEASAAPKAVLGSFGTPNGAGGGQLVFAKGVAVNQTGNGAPAGSVYVAEANTNHRISQFSEDGVFIRAWGFDVVSTGQHNSGTGFEICEPSNSTPADVCKAGLTGGAAGQLANPQGIAIDQSNGYLYVTSIGNRRVDVFSGTGQFAGAFGFDVVPADPNPSGPDFCTTATGCQAAATSGTAAGRFSNLNGSIPGVDPSVPGRVYVPDSGNLRVAQYSTTVVLGVLTSVTFDKAFGWGVGDGGAELQACTVTCLAGTSGNGAGQFTSGGSPTVAAVNSAGDIYVTSGPLTSGTCSTATPCRIQKFAPNASSATDFGPTTSPGQLVFTSNVAANAFAGINLAIDPANDHIFVLRKETETTFLVHEYTSAGTYVEAHPTSGPLVGNATTVSTGLAVGLNGKIYVNYGIGGGGKVTILGPIPAPHVTTIPPVEDVTCTSATVNGTVTIAAPGGPGFEADYNFEYSANGVQWIPVKGGGTTPSAAGIYNVSSELSGLLPNATYQARLVATTAETATSEPPLTFQTQSCAPSIALTFADEITQTSAELGAHINPGGLKSTYHFEWATEEEWLKTGQYGHRQPAFERQIGSGGESIVVKEAISGLAPKSRYHYRVVTHNSAAPGGTEGPGIPGPDQSFETLNSCGLTDQRCFELVSPSDKGPVGAAGDIAVLGNDLRFQATPDGSAIAYQVAYGLEDSTSGGEVLYEARRGSASWSSLQMSPPTPSVPSSKSTSIVAFVQGLSEDLSCGIYASTQPLSSDAPMGTLDAGKSVLYRKSLDGSYTPMPALSPTNAIESGEPLLEYKLIGMSEGVDGDCERVVFSTKFQYPGIPGTGVWRLYEWDAGTLRNVGEIPGPTEPVLAEAYPGALSQINYWNAVSEDAARIFFTATSRVGGDINKKAIYVRDRAAGAGSTAVGSATILGVSTTIGEFASGQTISASGIPQGTTILSVEPEGGKVKLNLSQAATASGSAVPVSGARVIDLSQSKEPGAPNTGDSRYETASQSGDRVFFTARYGLATNGKSTGATVCNINTVGGPNGPGCDLYQYDVKTGTLTDLSIDLDGAGAGVAGVLGASDDGRHIYFAARGQLVSGEGKTEEENLSDNSYSVYLSKEGVTRFVGTIGSQDIKEAMIDASGETSAGLWRSRVTPSGSHLLFESSRDVTGYDSGGAREAYIYDEDDGTTTCVSCRRDGGKSVAASGSARLVSNGQASNYLSPPRSMTEDGDRVFFLSPNRLATGAIAGEENLYQWEDGQIAFLAKSDPSVSQELQFAGASASGDDVFFTTVDRLTWDDVDGKLDVYDARVGGGIPQPPPGATPCDPLGEGSCQGALGVAGGGPVTPASSSFVGPGNEKADASKGKKPKKKGKKASKKGKKGKKKARGTKNNRGGAK